MNFEAVIGLEIHVELKTKTKMFSSAPVAFGKEPNSCCMPLDLGFPGTLPTVNKEAVIYGIRVVIELHMDIDPELHFDRKNYFYSDLPQGYQITQNLRPIGSNGYVDLNTSNGIKRIEIERIHLEEDTCMQHHFRDYTLLDYNRAGVPLIEIVSRPNIRTGEEAQKYVEKIRSIVVFSDVSDGKMEEGSLRCDVNISLRPYGSDKFGTKVEIKNLNSTKFIQQAIDFEIERQSKLLLQNQTIRQETRRYDEAKRETILMRVKTDAVDYKYFPEPNITPIVLSDEFVNGAIKNCPELADSKINRYINEYSLSEYDASLLVNEKSVSEFFDEAAKLTKSYKLLANWINVDIASVLNKRNISINELNITPKSLVALISLIDSKEISNNQARDIFNKMIETGKDPLTIKNELGITSQISDESAIMELINETLNEFPQSIIDFKEGKSRALGFLVGQIMKKSHGKVNPKITSDLLLKELKER